MDISYKTNFIVNLGEKKLLFFIFFFALVVRFFGIDYGYFNPDERVNFAVKALSGQFVPDQHFYPPLLNYITAVFFAMLYVAGRVLVAWYDVGDFRAQYFSDPILFYMVARFVVCLISAAIAPLFYLISRELGLTKKYSFVVALFGIFIPGMILLSHIYKSDVPLSVCVVFVFYCAIKKIKSPDSKIIDIFFGLSIALAFSFKHSYIFIFLPFSIFFIFIFLKNNKNIVLICDRFVYIIISTVMFWLVFNMGIVLDFENFIDYQKIQTVMSVRENKSVFQGLSAWWGIVGDFSFGINYVVTLLFLLSSYILFGGVSGKSLNELVFSFWLSLVVGSLIVMYLSGERQLSGLWVPYMVPMQLLAIIFICSLAQKNTLSALLTPLIVLVFFISLYGSVNVSRQAMAKPIVINIEKFIVENFQDNKTKILTFFPLNLPQDKSMKEYMISRDEKLSKKYSVPLPVKAIENRVPKNNFSSVHYLDMPMPFFGLENSDDHTLKEVMKAYAWPIQKEEWKLNYWLNKNFELFILQDHENVLHESNLKVLNEFHHEIKKRCQLLKYYEPSKPLYYELSASIYRCVI
ncbi:MAG: phospholipid carrier-dependent glycosyltransferase [Cellvibrionaceae bacterium]